MLSGRKAGDEHSRVCGDHPRSTGTRVLLLLKERGVWTAEEQSRAPGPSSVRKAEGMRKGGNFRDVLKTGSTGLNEVRDN